jgi:hypothetical protein
MFDSASAGIHAYLWPGVLILAIGLFYVLNLRQGLDWDGDDALYVLGAQNIIHGLPFAKTPYLFNPENAINPAAYPPGLPLLFAPVLSLFGVDLAALKIECIVTLTLFLGVFWALARKRIGPIPALITTLAIGLHPYIVSSSNTLGSEFPFLLFCYGGLLLFERLQSQPPPSGAAAVRLGCLAAFVAALTYLTRSIGIVLLAAAFVSSVWRTRRLFSLTTAVLTGAIVVCAVVQSVYRADVGTYIHYFDQFTVHGLVLNASRYRHIAVEMLGKSRFAVWFCSVSLIIAIVGFAARLKALSVLECFCAFYIGLLIVYPISSEAARYEMPIWPMLFLYCADGLSILTRQAGTRVRGAIVGAFVVSASLLYAAELRSLDFGPIPFSATDPRSAQLFDALRQLPAEARILARKPTVIALYTGHESSIWPKQFTDAQLIDFLHRMHIQYIVQDIPHMGFDLHQADPLDPFIDRNKSALEPVFSNAWFIVYRADM